MLTSKTGYVLGVRQRGAARQRRARSLLVRDPPTVVLQEDGDVAGFRQQGYEERLASDALSLSPTLSSLSLFFSFYQTRQGTTTVQVQAAAPADLIHMQE